jgi:hypothetical protein
MRVGSWEKMRPCIGPQRSSIAYQAVKLSPLPSATLDDVLDADG